MTTNNSGAVLDLLSGGPSFPWVLITHRKLLPGWTNIVNCGSWKTCLQAIEYLDRSHHRRARSRELSVITYLGCAPHQNAACGEPYTAEWAAYPRTCLPTGSSRLRKRIERVEANTKPSLPDAAVSIVQAMCDRSRVIIECNSA